MVGMDDLGVGVAARLHVAVEVHRGPADKILVAAVLGRAAHGVEGVGEGDVDQHLDLSVGGVEQDEITQHGRQIREAFGAGRELRRPVVEMGEPLAVDVLPSLHRAVELPLRLA